MPLKIAFVAWNAKAADDALLQFAVDNADQVKRFERRRRIILKDGTEIVNVHNSMLRDGQHCDQYIIADDSRKNVLKMRGAALNEAEYRCRHSIVPEEYRCQFYNLDEEDPQCQL